MNCCCPHDVSASKCFSRVARRYRRRFEKRGFERSQKQLLEGLTNTGFTGATVLEIGSGVGHLHMTLLERGAASAQGIDLAPKMIEEARRWARDRGLGQRTQYFEGDFMALADSIEPADVTLLDKVVCCYPDVDGLVHRSAKKTRRLYALTYPRNRWYVRLGVALGAVIMKLFGSAFRPYLHDPQQIEQWLIEAGFVKRYEASTFIWLTQVFERR